MKAPDTLNERSVAITRVFDAPRERVFAAWTEAQHLARWFGPHGFTTHSCEAIARPGGAFRLCMRSPEGDEYWVSGSFREVEAPARLVIECSANDEKGKPALDEVIEVTFTEKGGKTTLKLRTTALGRSKRAAEMLKGMEAGWKQTIERLGSLVTGPQGAPPAEHGSFTIERELPQPPARVFAAWSDPAAKAKWFSGPSGEWKPLEREMDFRVGGRERTRGRWKSGVVTDFQAHYLDIVPGRRIVYAYNMFVDERKISVSLATIELEPTAKGTRMRVTEQGAFLDGYDDAGSREHGTGLLMDALARSLEE